MSDPAAPEDYEYLDTFYACPLTPVNALLTNSLVNTTSGLRWTYAGKTRATAGS